MTAQEFAALTGVGVRAIQKRLKDNNPPKGIASFMKFGNTYMVTVNQAELAKVLADKLKRTGSKK